MDQAGQLSELIARSMMQRSILAVERCARQGRAFRRWPGGGNLFQEPNRLDRHCLLSLQRCIGSLPKALFQQIHKIRPLHHRPILLRCRAADAVADIMPYQEFLETRFYKEWVQPQGIVDAVTAVLDKSVTSAAMFGCFATKAMVLSTTKRAGACALSFRTSAGRC